MSRPRKAKAVKTQYERFKRRRKTGKTSAATRSEKRAIVDKGRQTVQESSAVTAAQGLCYRE